MSLVVGIVIGILVTRSWQPTSSPEQQPGQNASKDKAAPPPADKNEAKPGPRPHPLLSDLVIEAPKVEGFADPEGVMARIRKDAFLKDQIESVTPTLDVPAMLQYSRVQDGQRITRPIRLVGIEIKAQEQTAAFKKHLVNSRHRPTVSFELQGELSKKVSERIARTDRENRELVQRLQVEDIRPGEPPPPAPPMPAATRLPRGAFVGYLIASFRFRDPASHNLEELIALELGSDITLIVVGGEKEPLPVVRNFVVADFFKSDVSEHDSNCVYVPLDALQEMMRAPNRATGLQIKLKEGGRDIARVKEALEKLLGRDGLIVMTCEDAQQGQ